MNTAKLLILIFFTLLIFSCERDKKWKGQEPLKKVSTLTRPIQYQLKKTWYAGNGIYCSNDFAGARMNGLALTGDTVLTVLITPENTPVNSSPWYAFKLRADTLKNIRLVITYSEGYAHRYYPKISSDGIHWQKVDTTEYTIDSVSVSQNKELLFCSFRLTLGKDTTWIAAQPLITSDSIYRWVDKLAEKPFVTVEEIGKSAENRPIRLMNIGNPESKNLVMVLSRQHPPEVTGWLAMKYFVETLCRENQAAEKFREDFRVLVVPLANPDGVDNGHWRHNAHGIDLNRDWEDFNQPETQAIKNFVMQEADEGGKFIFAVDFHSTQEDIYYTIDPKLEGNMPGLVPRLIEAVAAQIPGYEPNIRPNAQDEPRISSTSFFFYTLGAESVTFEIGDNTPVERIALKGKLAAQKLMEILNSKPI